MQVGAPAPIFRSIARLSAPGLALAIFQTAVSIADTHFVGRLGTEPLAGLALVFPLVMLLQMTSAGAMGGGVSSAIARARGAGNEAAARRLVVHALVIALAAGLAFTLVFLLLGKPLYALLGGDGGTLAQAVAYSDILFGGAVLVWLANIFASSLRGGGSTSIHSELGPHDTGASRIHPMQYTAHDSDYYLSITVGSDVRYVSYKIHDHHVHAV